MPGIGPYRDNFPLSKLMASVYTRVRARLTANTPATVWDPGSGYKFVLKGYALSITCTTAADAGAAGNMLVLVDHNANAPILTLGVTVGASGVIVAGSSWPGIQSDDAIATAATVYANNPPLNARVDLREGFKSAAAGNVLKFALVDGATTAASVNCSAGVFILNGVVWGDLSSS